MWLHIYDHLWQRMKLPIQVAIQVHPQTRAPQLLDFEITISQFLDQRYTSGIEKSRSPALQNHIMEPQDILQIFSFQIWGTEHLPKLCNRIPFKSTRNGAACSVVQRRGTHMGMDQNRYHVPLGEHQNSCQMDVDPSYKWWCWSIAVCQNITLFIDHDISWFIAYCVHNTQFPFCRAPLNLQTLPHTAANALRLPWCPDGKECHEPPFWNTSRAEVSKFNKFMVYKL